MSRKKGFQEGKEVQRERRSISLGKKAAQLEKQLTDQKVQAVGTIGRTVKTGQNDLKRSGKFVTEFQNLLQFRLPEFKEKRSGSSYTVYSIQYTVHKIFLVFIYEYYTQNAVPLVREGEYTYISGVMVRLLLLVVSAPPGAAGCGPCGSSGPSGSSSPPAVSLIYSSTCLSLH